MCEYNKYYWNTHLYDLLFTVGFCDHNSEDADECGAKCEGKTSECRTYDYCYC